MNHRPFLTTLGEFNGQWNVEEPTYSTHQSQELMSHCHVVASSQSTVIKLELCPCITCIHYIHVEKNWKGLLIENVRQSTVMKRLLLTEYASTVTAYFAHNHLRNSSMK